MDIDLKMYKDRRILGDIDARLAVITRWHPLILVPLMVVTLQTGVAAEAPLMAGLAAAIGALLLLPMMVFSLRFRYIHGSGPARWRRIFKAVSLAWHLWLGVMVAVFWSSEQVDEWRWILPISVGILLILESDEWACYFEHHGLQTILMWLPLLAILLSDGGLTAAFDAMVLVAFVSVMFWKGKRHHERFWQIQRDLDRVRDRASLLSNEVSSAQISTRMQTDFLIGVTREIRTPMNNVLGALALLDDTELSPQQKQLQQVALKSGESLLTMAEDMLDFTRISSGQLTLEKTVFNLRKSVEMLLESLGSMAHERRMELILVAAEDLPLRVMGDRQRLGQVIQNLVMNAIEYSRGTEVVVELSHRLADDGRHLIQCEVRDDGRGMSAATRDRLFQAFATRAIAQRETVGGTGLGLAICDGLVRAMDGKIEVSTEEGRGTSFRFEVLLASSSQQAQKQSRQKSFAHWRVMMVDLTPALERSLTAFLGGWGMKTVSESGHDRAVARLKALAKGEEACQLVVVNCPFAVTDTFNFPAIVRDDPALRQVNVLVLGTLAQKGTLGAAAMGTAHVEWLVKPVTKHRLVDALEALSGERTSAPSHQVVAASRRAADAESAASEQRGRILLVEDNKVNQLVARGMLQKMGYEVTTVNNGLEAVGILQERRFDAVLMDCLMPEMDGYEATRTVRSLELQGDRHLPIIAMTASAGADEERRCLDAGMDDYLSKPVNIDELDAKLAHWVARGTDAANTVAVLVNAPPLGHRQGH